MEPQKLDYANIQGLIIRGFTHPYSCHMIFKFQAKVGAKTFIKTLLPYVQSAEDWGTEKPQMILNIGLTFSGVQIASDYAENELGAYFYGPFVNGPDSVKSQVSLMDLGESVPGNWVFGNLNPDTSTLEIKPVKSQVDCIVHIYAITPELLEKLVSIVSEAAQAGGFTEYFPLKNGKRLEQFTILPQGSVHFGYMDGIDEPKLDIEKSVDPDPSDLKNFLIGYQVGSSSTVAYNQYTPAPLGPLQPLTSVTEFMEYGCYNAFRMISQDVGLFEGFLDNQALIHAKTLGKSIDDTKEWLAAKLNGRWRNGSPLELSPDLPDNNTINSTDFVYGNGDDNKPTGNKCPFIAHTRVVNPRTEISGTMPPRLIRRGVPYGSLPILGNYEGERGLIGLFLCGSINGQFELIYGWINKTNFSDDFNKSGTMPDQMKCQDALVANRSNPGADVSFTIPTNDINTPIIIDKLPQFVVTKGTAYCFLPSLKALRWLAESK